MPLSVPTIPNIEATTNSATVEWQLIDTVDPVLTLLGSNPDTHEASLQGVYVDPGATADDDVDGDITGSIVATPPADALWERKPGRWSYTYEVSDAANNAATPLTRFVDVVDTTAPTAPTQIAAVEISQTAVEVYAQGAFDVVGIAWYNLYRGGVFEARLDPAQGQIIFTVSDMTPGVAEDFWVTAEDDAGNEGLASATVNIATTPATVTPPSAPLMLAVNPIGTELAPHMQIIWGRSNPGTGGAVQDYQVYRDDSLVQTVAYNAGITQNWTDEGPLSPATEYFYNIRARDTGLNVSDSSSVLAGTTLGTVEAGYDPGQGPQDLTVIGMSVPTEDNQARAMPGRRKRA